MDKLRIYLDTSVISHIEAFDVPEKMGDTIVMLQILSNESDFFETFLSGLTILELEQCSEPKRSKMMSFLQNFPFTMADNNEKVSFLTDHYLSSHVLGQRSIDDLTHIAYAVANRCSIIVSWNFKHFVNFKTIERVNNINSQLGYPLIYIISPHTFLEWRNENE